MYAGRLKQVGDEAFTIIASKFKETTQGDLTVPDLFELMLCDSLVRQMQAHPSLRDDYNQIVQHVDDCVTLEALAQKASKIADRKMSADVEPEVYFNKKSHNSTNDAVMEKLSAMEKKFTLMAKSEPQKSKDANVSKPKKKSGLDRNDPEWRKRVANKPCLKFSNYGKCDYVNCAFQPCNGKSNGQALFTQRDF